MALILSLETPKGVNASYWRIGVLNIHPRSKSIQVVLDGYPDAAVRETATEPLATLEGALAWSDELADGGREATYSAIKTQWDGWAIAEDHI